MTSTDISTGSVLHELGADCCQGRILLAEDDAAMRELLGAVLRRDGFEVLLAESGDQLLQRVTARVLRQADSRGVDLIISDVRMPMFSGIEVLEALRRCDWSVPCILISAFADEALFAEAERLGAMLFAKPFDLDDLRLAAAHLVRRGPER